MSIPYSPEALDRIRAGATARELGWDNTFYASVCHRHGLQSVTATTPAAAPLLAADIIPDDGSWSFNPNTKEVSLGAVTIALTRRQSELMLILVRARAHDLVRGEYIASVMDAQAGNVSNMIQGLRVSLRRLAITLEGHKGPQGGYRLSDPVTGDPIKIRIVSKKNGRTPP